MHTVLINYSEIILKGKNRPHFERALKENIRQSAQRLDVQIKDINREGASFVYKFDGGKKAIIKCLKNVFGIKQFLFTEEIPKELNKILEQVTYSLHAIKESGIKTVSFKTKRSDKTFPLSSPEINEQFGKIANKEGLKVDYSDKENVIYTKIGEKITFVSSEKIDGYGGLPTGTSGRILVLLSGGIDSPVAAWSLMKRGAHCDFLHIHNLRKSEDVLKTKMKKTIETLNNHQFQSTLYTTPYTPFELAVMENTPPKYELVVFKHYILKLAEQLANKYDYLAIANGDSLSQVASQTLENINTAQYDIKLPVLRPLISSNKEEIIYIAEKIGTYELSIEEYKDCCSLVAKHPATKTNRSKLKEALENIDMKKLLKESMSEMEIFKLK
jgi:thiamine biosynthesis protein ThiI